MRILRAELEDFRNISRAELELSPHFTALIGPNGQGKTNTLEALYLVSALRPLRNVARSALIRAGAAAARITVDVERGTTGLEHRLELSLDARTRTLSKDGKRIDAGSFLGTLVSVAFTPDDLQLAKGGPDARRRFLDRALLNLRPAYLSRALRYAKAVRDRNRVLADEGPDEVLEVFDELVAREGAEIARARDHYVAELEPRVREHFERIARPAPTFAVRYATSLELSGEEETRGRFLERLRDRRKVDRRRRTTSVGPHLDDLELTLDGQQVRERASQGQHRAIVLALKLAEIVHLTERLGEPPVLLLDDMSSELDPERSLQLFELVAHLEGQVILTSTEEPRALEEALGAGARYRVQGGALARMG